MDHSKLRELIVNADKGEIESINILHDYYFTEKALDQQFDTEQINFYEKGYEENKPYSTCQLAIIYMYGLGNVHGDDKCEILIKKGMELKCSLAVYLYGILEEDYGNVVNADILFKKAIIMGNITACLKLATKSDEKKSIMYLNKAIKLGSKYAINQLGQYFHDKKEYKLAQGYYKKACNLNIHHGFFNLAIMYLYGEGYEINVDKAIELFEQAIQNGSVRALTCLGNIYEKKNENEKAKDYYVRSIEKNDPVSCYNLGKILLNEEKTVDAYMTFIKGAKFNHDGCLMIINRAGLNVKSTKADIEEILSMKKVFGNFGAWDSTI